LAQLWPHLSDGHRETLLKVALHTAKANGFVEPPPTLFVAEPDPVKPKRAPLGVDGNQQRRARLSYDPENIPF
jgi:hypothetical protein